MEVFGIIDIPVWIFLTIFSVLLIYKYSVYPYTVWRELGVDGPKPVPFFGNTLDIYNPKIGSRCCIEMWRRKYGKVFGVYFMRKPVLVVTDKEMLKSIFVKDFHDFADRHIVGDGKLINRVVRKSLFFATGADWHRMRRVMTPTFSGAKLRQLIHHVNRTAQGLAENFQESAVDEHPIDAKDFFGAYTLDVIAGLAFGLDINSQKNFDLPFIQNAKSLMNFTTLNRLKVLACGFFPPILALFQFFDIGFFDFKNCQYFEESIYSLISQRKGQSEKDKRLDFLQLLLEAEAEEDSGILDSERQLTSLEVAGQCIIFIIAGYESTANTLQYVAYELARHQDVQESVLEEIQRVVGDREHPTYEHVKKLKYTTAVISEVMRMYPHFNMITRQTVKECTLGDLTLPAKAGVLIPAYNIARDPENYPDPDEFRPERFMDTSHDVTFLPFGFGPRLCIGQRLVLMEIKLALVQILRKVIIRDVSPKELKFDDRSGLLVPSQPIKLTARQRQRS